MSGQQSAEDDISDEALDAIVAEAQRIEFNDVDGAGTRELLGYVEWLVDRVKLLRDAHAGRGEATR